MRKPSYGVVSWVLFALAVFGVGLRAMASLIPAQPANLMASETADFLNQGKHERVDWRTANDDTFAEARRKGKPILLLIGCSWSQFGRTADQTIFTDSEVQTFLARNFLCTRVDGSDHPEWLSAYLPFSRAGLAFVPEFQIYILDSDGEMIDLLSPLMVDRWDAQRFLELLIRARDVIERIRRGDPAVTTPGSRQQADLTALAAGPEEPANVVDLHEVVAKGIDTKSGGFLEPDARNRRLWPQAWQELLLGNSIAQFQSSFDPLLQTSMIDWLDGGFRARASTSDWTTVEWDKVAVQNAEMLQLMLLAYSKTADPIYNQIAKGTFNSLTTEFVQDSSFSPCRIGDEGLRKRSARASFSVRHIREMAQSGLLTSSELDFARDQMGLRVETNPQLSIKPKNPRAWNSAEAERILVKLRDFKSATNSSFAGGDYLNVSASVVAKLSWASRFWGDPMRRELARNDFDHLTEYVAGDGVLHSLTAIRNQQATLDDYLAFCDAALRDFELTGRDSSWKAGARHLKRAVDLFASETPGLYTSVRWPSGGVWPTRLSGVGLDDGLGESSTAKLLRLTFEYGCLLEVFSPSEPVTTDDLWSVGEMIRERLSTKCAAMGYRAAGFIAANRLVEKWSYLLFVGPQAKKLADVAFVRSPQVFGVPAIGDVRPEIAKLKPGIYLVRGTVRTGPLRLEQALAEIGS